jgi:hypothetical protein
MTTRGSSAAVPTTATAQTAHVSLWGATTPPSWPWRRGALLLAGAAQLITISALNSTDRLPVTWWALLLAIAPAPLAAVAAFGPKSVRMPAAWAAVAVMLAGLIGGILHTGLFFAPALVVMVIGAVRLSRESA